MTFVGRSAQGVLVERLRRQGLARLQEAGAGDERTAAQRLAVGLARGCRPRARRKQRPRQMFRRKRIRDAPQTLPLGEPGFERCLSLQFAQHPAELAKDHPRGQRRGERPLEPQACAKEPHLSRLAKPARRLRDDF